MIPNFKQVSTVKNIWRGGQPDDAGWNQLNSMGIRRVVKLNTEGEASDVAAEALGMALNYQPIELDDQLIFLPNKQAVHLAVASLREPDTFVHCSHGQDRTGLIIGCSRVWIDGWEKDAAWKEMMENGFHPELLGLTLFWEWHVADL